MEQIGQRMQRRAEKVTQGPQYDQQMLMYQTAMAARAAGVTYSPVPPPGGTTVIPPGQGGAAAGAGGTGGGGATTTTIPPTGGTGAVNISAQAEEFIKFYRQYQPYLQQSAIGVRAEIGAPILGVGAVLGGMGTDEIKQRLSQFSLSGEASYQLNTRAIAISGKLDKVDPRVLAAAGITQADLENMVGRATKTDTSLGEDLTDLMSMFKYGFKGDKPGGKAAKPER